MREGVEHPISGAHGADPLPHRVGGDQAGAVGEGALGVRGAQRSRHTGSPLLSRTQALLAGHSEEAAPVGVVQREVQKSAVRPDGAVVDRQSEVSPPQSTVREQFW